MKPKQMPVLTSDAVSLKLIPVEKPDDFRVNVIIGMSHFIKTVDDLYEAVANVSPATKFGVAFCEASGPKLIRTTGTDKEMIELAVKNARAIGAGHSFVLFLNGTFPVNIMHALRTVPEIVNIFCATSNPVSVVVAENKQGRGILGVIDGGSPLGVEGDKDVAERKQLLRDLGYKL